MTNQPDTGDMREQLRNLPKTVWPTHSRYPNHWMMDVDEVIALFADKLAGLLEEKQVCYDCNHEDDNLENIPYIPVSAVEKLMEELKS